MGEYSLASLSSYKSSPKFTFTSAPALKDKKANIPGPGNYKPIPTDRDKFRRSASWSMGSTSNASEKEWSSLPGPGAYALPSAGSIGPQWAFTTDSRLREKKKSSTPGPGAYETRKKGLGGLEMSISSKPDGAKPWLTPGPATYKPSNLRCSTVPSSPSVSFGVGVKADKMSQTPGPGAYKQKGTLGGICYSIKGRYDPPKAFVTPGPGAAASSFK
mmetsp:Transcript_87732/g.174124  ORF Transcript_87732/g.174124 Transcript_87732/m.174124 type:complete len:216 (+) Transcript_87732:83-730(+)